MSSSTSSSDERRPAGPWPRTLLCTALLVVAGVVAWEGVCRGWAGLRPTVEDDAATWLAARDDVRPTSTVLLSTSRGMAGLRPEVWAEQAGVAAPIQLGLVGASLAPVLGDLASDVNFHGTVVVDMVPALWFDAAPGRSVLAATMVEEYERWQVQPSRRWEAHLRRALEARLAFLGAPLSPAGALAAWVRGEPPPPPPVWELRPDRSVDLDFQRWGMRWDLGGLLEPFTEQTVVPSPERRQRLLDHLRWAAATLEGRGGQLVVVRLPSSGPIARAEAERFPRAEYWDAVAAIPGLVAVHHADHPELSRFATPDGSHVEGRDAPAFTRALVSAIAAEAPAARGSPPAGAQSSRPSSARR